MKRSFFIVILALPVGLLAGCGTSSGAGYAYGSGSGSSSSSFSNAGVLGTAGAAIGSQAKNPVIGAAGVGVLGYYFGKMIDQQEAATGTTSCNYNAGKKGDDRNGAYSQGAQSTKTVPGYKGDCN